MNVNPLGDVIVIRRLPPSEVSEGGIFLAWEQDYKEDIGIVEYVGQGKRYGCKHCKTEHVVAPAVKKGDKILFSTNGHQITTIAGQELVILREPSIIGVIEDGTASERS